MDSLSGGRTGTFPYIECVFPKSFDGEPVAEMPLEIKSIVNVGLDVQEALGSSDSNGAKSHVKGRSWDRPRFLKEPSGAT